MSTGGNRMDVGPLCIEVREPIPSLREDVLGALAQAGHTPCNCDVAAHTNQTILIWAIEPDGGTDVLQGVHSALVIALVETLDSRFLAACFSAGAKAILPRGKPSLIGATVTLIAEGSLVLPRALAHLMDQRRVAPELLAQDELRWMRKLASGRPTSEVARDEGYSERAMYRRLRSIYDKLGTAGRTEALLVLARANLLDLREADADRAGPHLQ